MHVVYYGPYSATTGYGRACRDYLAALDRHRPDVQLTVVDITSSAATAGLGRAPDAEPRFRHLDRLVRADAQHVVDEADPALVVLVHATPDALTLLAAQPHAEPGAPPRAQNGGLVPFWRANQVPILAMTTFDAPALDNDPFPALAYDRVIVPSNYAFECAPGHLASRLLDDGWQSSIAIVPHAYDATITPAPGVLPYPTAPGAVPWFTFYSIGAWGERKNLLGVLRAYLHAFTAEDQVQLHLHIPDLSDTRQALVQGILAASGIPKDRRPIVTLSRGYLPEADVEAIHAAGACFVTASRGEAWNLPLFEAAARGKLLLAPNVGPHESYLDGRWRRVPTREAPVAAALELTTVEGRPAMTTSMPHGLTARHMWPDPDLRAIASEMVAMYMERNSEFRVTPTVGRDLTAFAYPAVADRLFDVFSEHVR